MMTDRKQLEASILALESQRAILGDAVVNSSIEILREKLAALNQSVMTQTEQAGERKLVTVMFADISGFTSLSERLDPEQVRALVNACFSWLVPIIEKYGGVVEKFIGDEIMAMFGAPVAHENDAERALRASLDMMAALAEFNRKHLTSLGMHFGINTGIVVAGGLGSDGRQQYGVMGDAVNVAARLEDVSETGQIVIGPNTYRLTASLFKFDMLPPVRAKGKSEPIQVYRLVGIKAESESTRGISGLRSPLVGRTSELNMLTETVLNLKTRGGGILSIVAEAGLGKSRLVSEAYAATRETARWVEGRALSYAEGISYWTVHSMIDHLIGVKQDAPLAEVSAALREFVERHLHKNAEDVFPYLARLRDVPMDATSEGVIKDLLPQALQDRIHAAFVALICAIAETGPLVLVWEDLHWADHSSLGLLETLLPQSIDLPLLLVLVLRPNEGRTWEWHKRIAAQIGEHYRVLEIAPLTPSDSVLLVENLLKIENMPEATQQLILNKSEGNPFFLEELLRSLIDSGMVLVEGDHAVATQSISQLEVPDTLQGVIAARIDRLPADDKYTLQTASVIGRVFQQVVLGYLLQRQHANVPLELALSELQQRELIRWRGELEYIFKHAITRDVTYNSLLIARRKELHRATAETIEMLFPDQLNELAPILAYHFNVAEASEKAAEYFMRAGDRAMQTYANLEAVAFYRAALQQWENLGDKSKLIQAYENLGIVMSLIGQVDDAIEAFEKALNSLDEDDTATRARLYRRQGNAYNVSRRVEEMLAVFDRAVAIPALSNAEAIYEWINLQLDRIRAYYFASRLPEMIAIISEARTLVEERGTLAQLARWYESLVLLDIRRHNAYQLPDETLSNAWKQVETARTARDRRLIGRAVSMLGFVHLWRNELDEAEQSFLSALKDVEAVGDVDTQFVILNYMSLIGRKRENVELTQEWASRTLLLARKANSLYYQGTALGSLAWVEFHKDNDEGARTYSQEALTIQKKAPSSLPWFMVLGPALALEIEAKNWSDAIQHVKMLLQPSQQKMPDELQSTLEQAIAYWEAGDQESTEAMFGKSIEMMKKKQLGYV
jgi:class 3 adenylate cyclase/tetratricopeptide (TPR) repeat protein